VPQTLRGTLLLLEQARSRYSGLFGADLGAKADHQASKSAGEGPSPRNREVPREKWLTLTSAWEAYVCRNGAFATLRPAWAAKMGFGSWFLPLENSIMNTTVTLDKAGRVVIPKSLRDELHLEPGDTLQLESEGERVTLRPLRSSSPLQKEQGVWVFRGSKRLTAAATEEVFHEVRHQRDRDSYGRS
jgi:AbrB family looped-hinge helix DNA binding protein